MGPAYFIWSREIASNWRTVVAWQKWRHFVLVDAHASLLDMQPGLIFCSQEYTQKYCVTGQKFKGVFVSAERRSNSNVVILFQSTPLPEAGCCARRQHAVGYGSQKSVVFSLWQAKWRIQGQSNFCLFTMNALFGTTWAQTRKLRITRPWHWPPNCSPRIAHKYRYL